MFHRPQPATPEQPQETNQQHFTGAANQNQGNGPKASAPSYTPNFQHQAKDTAMNAITSEAARDQNQDHSQTQPGNNPRMDIPGGSFQRPGQQPMAGRIPGSYPGAYNPAPAAAAPASANPYMSSSTAANQSAAAGNKLLIGQGITLSGEIEACDYLVVEGTVEAALKGAKVLEIAESGAFFGTVEIDEATIAGSFEGDLTVKGRLTIKSTGSITGAIAYKELAVEAGATLDGKVSPLDGKQNNNAKKANFNKGGRKGQDNGAELPFSDKSSAQ